MVLRLELMNWFSVGGGRRSRRNSRTAFPFFPQACGQKQKRKAREFLFLPLGCKVQLTLSLSLVDDHEVRDVLVVEVR